MSIAVNAVYENGTVNILDAVSLQEKQQLTVLIHENGPESSRDHSFLSVDQINDYFPNLPTEKELPTLEDVRNMWSKVSDSMADEVTSERLAQW